MKKKTIACLVFLPMMVLFGSLMSQAGPPLGQGYEFAGNGKRTRPLQPEVWKLEAGGRPPEFRFSDETAGAAEFNVEAAETAASKGKIRCGNLPLKADRLIKTAKLVAGTLRRDKTLAQAGVRLYRCRGEDGMGNVHFTGYFTPRLNARRKADGRFRFPLYRMPTGKLKPWPAREAIDQNGALASQGLELAWTDDLLDLYFLHVQGSGQLAYPDGTLEGVGFAGGNGHAYNSLGRFLVQRGSILPEAISLRSIRRWMEQHPEELVPLLNTNPSYTFFRPAQLKSRGTANVDLIPGHSVAADLKMYPLGACLLAEVPRLDRNGKLQGYDLRLLFVHDTGSAIQGPGHLDLYHGVGREAGESAGDLHHYGRIWLLLAD